MVAFADKVKVEQEKLGEMLDEATAIHSVADKDSRDLTAEENSRVDEIVNEEIPQQKAKIARAEKLDAEITGAKAVRLGPVIQQADGPGGVAEAEERPRAERVKIPARARYRHSSLKAFKGKDPEKSAYLCGKWILATMTNDASAIQWFRDSDFDVRNVMTTTDNELGGTLVPDEMERTILDLKEEYGVMRREAEVVPMASDVKIMPRRSSGLTTYYLGETTATTASDMKFDNFTLTAKELSTLTRISMSLDEDAIVSLADTLAEEIAYQFALAEDSAGFIGDGSATYGGISGLITAILAGSRSTATTGNTSFGELELVDFENMVGALPLYATRNAKWYIHRTGWAASMMRLLDAGGGNTISDLQTGTGQSFLGYPVVFSQALNSTTSAQVSTNGLAYFGDMRQTVTLGTRRGISFLVSPHRYMEFRQIGILGSQRYDIAVHEVGTASVAGSMIQLSTPGS